MQELDLYDVLSFDSEFGKILQEFQTLVSRKRYLETINEGNERAITDLHFHGAPIEDLFLDFTLPGHPDYILKEAEESMLVLFVSFCNHFFSICMMFVTKSCNYCHRLILTTWKSTST